MNVTATLRLSSLDIEVAGLNFMRCHRWLEEAYASTDRPDVRRLIDEVMDELWALGSVDGELGELVLGALESVSAAVEIGSLFGDIA